MTTAVHNFEIMYNDDDIIIIRNVHKNDIIMHPPLCHIVSDSCIPISILYTSELVQSGVHSGSNNPSPL